MTDNVSDSSRTTTIIRNMSLQDVLAMKDDPIVGRMKVSTLIETLPGYGKAKAEKIMGELKIAESRRLKGLGERQEAALLERLA